MAKWWAILARTRRRMGKDNLSALAAGAPFQSLLSLFPTLTAVVSLYGLVADPNMVERQITAMQGMLPPEAVKLIATWLQTLVQGPTAKFGIGLNVSVLLALWSIVVGNGDADDRRQRLLRRGREARIRLIQPSCFGAWRRPRALWHRCACAGGSPARRPRPPAGIRCLGRPAGARPLAASGRDRHPCARHRLPLRARSSGAEVAMDQLGIGRGNGVMDLGLDRLHDLRLEGRQLRQHLR